jgi:hypothetical protein
MEAAMGLLRVCLTVTTVVLAQRMRRWGVDAAVVLAADVTRSIDDGEFVPERR